MKTKTAAQLLKERRAAGLTAADIPKHYPSGSILWDRYLALAALTEGNTMANNKDKIQEMQAEIKRLELEDVRNTILAEDPGWLSEADKYMVSVSPNLLGDEGGASVTVYRWQQSQSSGSLSKADLISLRDYLNTLIK